MNDTHNLCVGLISCTKRKRAYACKACELYSASSLFQKAYSYCLERYDRVYILSAKYGLLLPDQWIDPYDETLKNMGVGKKKEWASSVSVQFHHLFNKRKEEDLLLHM
ncbi:hypothetical protein GTO91_11925 [Heliobacterium undosum]|uniref:DUF6884 domain-containing protein n=1 Tax=Heliomicrobium undosum TaxID=121734 RepID=A0A845LBX5_9FIRM|nr:DUF6884 domain-containing protein [Heliomicrobium undosum]MZP30421.1 hypothetical protein [Heliomicrobium undosum]